MGLLRKVIRRAGLVAVLGASAFAMSACASDGYYGRNHYYHDRYDHHDRRRHDDRRHDRGDSYREHHHKGGDRRCYDRNRDGYCD